MRLSVRSQRGFVAALVVLVFLIASCFVDPKILLFLTLIPLFWIGVPAILLALASVLSSRSKGQPPARVATSVLFVVFAFGCFAALALLASQLLHDRAEAAGKAYPALVAPLLEAYRHTHGRYPARLEQLPAKPKVPLLLRRSFAYRSDGTSYELNFMKPGGLFEMWALRKHGAAVDSLVVNGLATLSTTASWALSLQPNIH